MSVEPSTDRTIVAAQQLRLRRFAMAAATYAGEIVATAIVASQGMGSLRAIHWIPFVGFALAINGTFFWLFRTGRNLRFRDPSLTQAQILVASAWGLLPLYDLAEARPVVLMFFLPAFSFGMLRLSRRQYGVTMAIVLALYAGLLAGEYAFARPGFRLGYQLVVYLLFALLVGWLTFFGGFVSDLRRELVRKRNAIESANEKLLAEVDERHRVASENERLIRELRQSLAQVKRLSGLLPICASCKKIRDDHGYWNQIEAYLLSHSEAEFTHGICPECAEALYGDLPVHPSFE